jgi:VPDSG-CTERM motif
MKAMRVVIATCAVLAAMSGVAQASLVLIGPTPESSFVDLGAQGFGAAPRLLTLQTKDLESGFETPIDVEHGDAIDGANKSTTPTIGTIGWVSGADVGIGFNSNQEGQTGITMQDLVLTIYNGTTAIQSFFLGPAFIDFSVAALALQQGNGNAVFDFHLDAAQQAAFDAILALPGSSGFYVGLGATLGCPGSVGCMVSNDGADSFVAFRQGASTPVPDGGSTLTLLGSALIAFGMLRRRLRS